MQVYQSISVFLLTFLTLFIFTSCERQVDFQQIVDFQEPLHLTTLIKDDRSMLGDKHETIIEPGSEKYIHFQKWLSENKNGWKKTIASYEPRSVIAQKDFQLNYMGYFVAVKYKDASGKSFHLSKSTNIESLVFLFD